MTEHETIPGAVYAVEAEGHIQVINPAGVVVYEGENALSFPAVHASYDILPEGAAVRQVFKCAPRTKLHLLMGGAGGWLPQRFTELEYLESSGTQIINTKWAPFSVLVEDVKSGYMVDGAHLTDKTWVATAGIERFAGHFEFRGAVRNSSAFIAQFCNQSFQIDGEQEAIQERFTVEVNFKNSRKCIINTANQTKSFNINTDNNSIFVQNINFCLFGVCADVGGLKKTPSRIWRAKISEAEDILGDFIPALDPAGAPCMFDRVSRKPFYNAGSGDFIAGLTLRQARELRLPSGGGSLTLSLPYEASVDAAAQAALERARAAGWTLTLQYREGVLPAGYRKLEFLESTGTQSIYSPDEVTPESGFELQYQQIEPFTAYVNPWLIGRYWKDEADRRISLGVGASTRSDIQSVFFSNYGTLPDAVVSLRIDAENDSVYVVSINKNNDSILTIDCGGETLTGGSSMFPYLSAPETPIIGKVINRYGASERKAERGRCYSLKLYKAGVLIRSFIPILDQNGVPCMYDTVTATPFYNSGTGAFIAGLATIDDVRTLYLAPTGGSITLSVPAETPQGYIAALQRNNPNWTISIQYRKS